MSQMQPQEFQKMLTEILKASVRDNPHRPDLQKSGEPNSLGVYCVCGEVFRSHKAAYAHFNEAQTKIFAIDVTTLFVSLLPKWVKCECACEASTKLEMLRSDLLYIGLRGILEFMTDPVQKENEKP